jgi:hypothetical protein
LEILLASLQGILTAFTYFWWVIVLLLLIFAWQNRRKAEFVENQECSILRIKIPRTNDKDPTAAEMMFATLHGILKPGKEHIKEGTIQEHIGFEIVANCKAINFYVWMPKNIKDFVEGQIYAQYPSADITEVKDYTSELDNEEFTQNRSFAGAELELTKADYLPIKTFNNFQVDPLASITGVLCKLEGKEEQIWIQILARPVDDDWKTPGLNYAKAKKEGRSSGAFNFSSLLIQPIEILKDFLHIMIMGPLEAKEGKDGPKLSSEEDSIVAGIEEKSEKLAFSTKIRLVYIATDSQKSKERIQATIGAFKQFNTTNLNGFRGKNAGSMGKFLSDYKNRLFLDEGFHLNIEEIASIYHLPHTSVETPNISWTTFKTAEPPTNLPTLENTEADQIALFAETNFRTSKPTVFGIKRDDRRRHMYIIGKTGMGKTKLMENLVINDIKNGEGVAIIDPHGESYEFILNRIPKERLKDVVIFNPADTQFPVAFNPMEVIDESLKIQTASGIVGTFKKIFGYSWGPRLEYIFNYTVLALLDTEGATLLGVVRMLTDKKFRAKIVENVKDPIVKKFWTDEFATYNDKYASEAIAPILNKVGQFISNSLIRNVIGQPKSSFNIRELMDNQKIFLINLSVGRIGETNATLLGSFMITAIHLAAMSRANIDEEQRKDFYFYVDEFQNFATESFNNILSEARKYRLNLTIANQFLAQIEDSGVKDAVFGNIGTMVTFRVGAADAAELSKEFTPPFEAQDIINLPRQHIYLKMIIDGQAEAPFSAKALTIDLSKKSDFVGEIIEHSRQNFANPVKEVESIVSEWAGMADEVKRAADERSGKVFDEVKESPEFKIEKRGNKIDNNKLANIIRESTKDAKKKIEEPKKEEEEKKEDVLKPKKVVKVNEDTLPKNEGRIQDRIDKETLSAILEKVVKPTAGKKDESQVAQVAQVADGKNENKIIKKESKKESKTEEAKTEKNIIENETKQIEPKPKTKENNRVVIQPPTQDKNITEINKKEIPKAEAGHFPALGKKEKLINSKNFKDIKEIHPHEVVLIEENEPRHIKEGQEIKFKE